MKLLQQIERLLDVFIAIARQMINLLNDPLATGDIHHDRVQSRTRQRFGKGAGDKFAVNRDLETEFALDAAKGFRKRLQGNGQV